MARKDNSFVFPSRTPENAAWAEPRDSHQFSHAAKRSPNIKFIHEGGDYSRDIQPKAKTWARTMKLSVREQEKLPETEHVTNSNCA
jgi:hypothetical protein